MQRSLLVVYTFAEVPLSLRHSTEVACADSNGDVCTVYKNSECCDRQQSLRCINASKMLPVRCNIFFNKTLASLPRKKKQSGNLFLDVITCKYDNSCA